MPLYSRQRSDRKRASRSHSSCYIQRMTTTLKRDELYALVWSEPTSKIAARHGISDRGLGKRARTARGLENREPHGLEGL
jgi:hypothetical protein